MPMALRVGAARSLADATTRPLAHFAGVPVAAVAGIGNPQRYFAALAAAGLQVEAHPFPDHHAFVADDFAALPRPLLMTEKDAVKCRGLGLADAWAVPVHAELPAGFFRALDSQMELLGHGRS
jgi:tetraacyldisaccharide 4'-kinase